ncbi:hypothetical protein C5L30_001357 [Companilactobacillus farciminis]|uniref:S-layer protein C-terminal domain-containing protein n=2 Tax=Companilactobacillus farciminis TaxID=1612 RepID=A0A4R5NH54_9LACO|nr:hypothetical protein C5L30_001357 [Companilactobacillus farciminis]
MGAEERSVIDMLLNKKCVYLGVTLFSALILGGVTTSQTAKAATTSDTTTSTTSSTSSTSTSPSTTTVTSPVTTATSSTTAPTTSTSTSPTTSTTSSGTTASPTTTASSSTAPTTSTSTTGSTVTSPTTTTSSSTTPTTSTSTSPTTSTTSSSTATSPTTTTSSSTAPTTSTSTTGTTTSPTTSTSTSGTTAPTTSTTTTSTITIPSTSSSTTTTPATGTTTTTSPTSTTTTTGTDTTGTSTMTSTATTGTNPYVIPSNVTDSTVVNFADPLLGAAVKTALNIPASDPITVGDIKGYVNPTLGIMMTSYEMDHPAGGGSPQPGSSMTDQQDTPIESLDGMQYLQLLPTKTSVIFQAKLASDENANTDLRPLDGINFSQLTLDGNFSDSDAKEIDVSQLADLNLSKATYFELSGGSTTEPTGGLNNQELAEVAPTIVKFANNGQSYHTIELGYSGISDFTPLQGVESGQGVSVIAVSNTVNDPTPIYAVTGQPITFTAPKLLDLDGKDLAGNYHYSSSVLSTALKDDNLTNNDNDSYTLTNADPNAKYLTYGQIGFADYTPDAYTYETKGTTLFENVTMVSQPLVWQAHPTVTINYVDSSGQPILSDGAPMTKTIDGNLIGDSYDLTSDSQVPGYTLTSPTTSLTGTFTQSPKVVDLTYEVTPQTSSSETTQPVVTQPTTTTTTSSTSGRVPIAVYDVEGDSPSAEKLEDMGVRATTQIDGQLFYLVGYGQWVLASDYSDVVSPTSGVVRTFDSTSGLVNAYGQPVSEKLMPNTEWKYSKIVTINGAKYYQVATDEFLPVQSGVEFVSTKGTVKTQTRTALYDSQGKSLGQSLSSGTSWYTDGYAMINGVKMYRVATDEWIPASDVI